MNRCLFIGGDNDGCTITLSELPTCIRLPKITGYAGNAALVQTEDYIRCGMAGNARMFTIYVARHLSPDDVTSLLLKHYNPPRPRRN